MNRNRNLRSGTRVYQPGTQSRPKLEIDRQSGGRSHSEGTLRGAALANAFRMGRITGDQYFELRMSELKERELELMGAVDAMKRYDSPTNQKQESEYMDRNTIVGILRDTSIEDTSILHHFAHHFEGRFTQSMVIPPSCQPNNGAIETSVLNKNEIVEVVKDVMGTVVPDENEVRGRDLNEDGMKLVKSNEDEMKGLKLDVGELLKEDKTEHRRPDENVKESMLSNGNETENASVNGNDDVQTNTWLLAESIQPVSQELNGLMTKTHALMNENREERKSNDGGRTLEIHNQELATQVSSVKQLNEQLQAHMKTIGILSKEKTELQSSLSASQQTAKQKAGEVEELQERLRASRQREIDLERELKRLKSSFQQSEKGATEDNKETDRLRLENDEMDQSNCDLRLQVFGLKRKLAKEIIGCQNFDSNLPDVQNELLFNKLGVQQLSRVNSFGNPSQIEKLQHKIELEARPSRWQEQEVDKDCLSEIMNSDEVAASRYVSQNRAREIFRNELFPYDPGPCK